MERETAHDTHETDVIVLKFWQKPTRVHVLKYEPAAREAHKRLRKIIGSMNRYLHYGYILDTVPYTFYGMEIYTPYDAIDTQYLEALCEAMSKIERDLQQRKDKWNIDKFDNNYILNEVHRVFFDLMYHKKDFLDDVYRLYL